MQVTISVIKRMSNNIMFGITLRCFTLCISKQYYVHAAVWKSEKQVQLYSRRNSCLTTVFRFKYYNGPKTCKPKTANIRRKSFQVAYIVVQVIRCTLPWNNKNQKLIFKENDSMPLYKCWWTGCSRPLNAASGATLTARFAEEHEAIRCEIVLGEVTCESAKWCIR